MKLVTATVMPPMLISLFVVTATAHKSKARHRKQLHVANHTEDPFLSKPGAWKLTYKDVDGKPDWVVDLPFHTLSTCPIFYQTLLKVPSELKEEVSQWEIRRKNVERAIADHPELHLKKMNVLYWARDWETIKDLFQGLGLSIKPGTMNQGKCGRWATMIMMAAWQRHAGHACTIALEDDILIPDDFKERLAQISQTEETPEVIKFRQWGEGYAFNLKAVDQFMSYLTRSPVIGWPSDNCINAGCAGNIVQRDVGIRKLVATNAGNIWTTPSAEIWKTPDDVDRNKAWQELTSTSELGREDLSAAARAAADKLQSFHATRRMAFESMVLHSSLEDFYDGETIDLFRAAKAIVRRMQESKK